MALPRSLAPFRQRAYARFWFGAFVSNIGTWMETVAVGILVTTKTGQAGWAGLVAAAGFVPSAFAGLLGGALADRIPRRRLLITTMSIQTTLAALLTVLAALDAAEPLGVTMIVFASGCAAAIGFPTYQALLPDLVPVKDLPAAIALGSAQWNLGRVVGPALAGIVVGLGGFAWAFGLNALSFFAVIAAVAPMRLPPPPPHNGESIRTSITGGFRFVRRDSGVRAELTYLACNSLLAAPFIALIPAVALKVFDQENVGTSVLVTAQGLGAVLMALLMGGLSFRFGLRRVVLGALLVLPFTLAAYAQAPTLALAAVAIFFVGAAYLGCLSGVNTVAQMRAPTALRGRVMSMNMLVLGVVYPVGAITQGWIADSVGLRTTTLVAAAALGAIVLGIRVLHPGFDREMGPATVTEVLDAPLDRRPLDRQQEDASS
ncbi:MAG: MFS transporter [Actinomycetota bacterium]